MRSASNYRYLDWIMAAFVTVLLCSNLIGAPKVASYAGFSFTAGVFFFPMSYIFGDILTEVYGYAASRRVVWAGFAAMFVAAVASAFVIALPPAPGWPHQAALEAVFASTPRIFVASLVGYFVGEFMNSYVLAKMKVWSQGRHLWMRTIGSTIVGEAMDSVIFYPIAFWGLWPNDVLVTVMITNYLIKVGCEVVMTPVTYRVVSALKRAEGVDVYDRDTDFNPFRLEKEGRL